MHRFHATDPYVLLGLGSLLLAGCGGGTRDRVDTPQAGGAWTSGPDGALFRTDSHDHGFSTTPRITRLMYGRLVTVYGLDAHDQRVLMFEDFVIDPHLTSDGQHMLVETNPVTGQQLLVILEDVTDEFPNGGLERFLKRLDAAEAGLVPIHTQGPGNSGLYSMVPRNAAVVVHFDDLLDPSTLDPTSVQLRAGTPPVVPFEARVFFDAHHGGLADHDGVEGDEFYSSRLVIDPTVSELESFAIDPPLPLNASGFYGCPSVNISNLELRFPTKTGPGSGLVKLLRNPSGHALTAIENGPVDENSPTKDVVRAARAGGDEEVTGDPYNGFLPDSVAPRLIGVTPIEILAAPQPQPGFESVFRIPQLSFTSLSCAQSPRAGDVVRQPGLMAEVLSDHGPVDGSGLVKDVYVRLLAHPYAEEGDWSQAAVGSAQFHTAFDPVEDLERAACFVRPWPQSTGFPEHPLQGVATSTTLALRFSEPMDPSSLTAFDSMLLTRVDPSETDGLNGTDYVIGSLAQSIDLVETAFLPDLPLAHVDGQSESYWLSLAAGERGPTDLAGNPLLDELPPVEMTIEASQSTQHNGGRVFRFGAVDEQPPFGDETTGPLPEWSGQMLYDLQREVIKPRPVVHFLGLADRSRAVPKVMKPFDLGVQTPLSGHGSKLQTLWRYCDFGWSLSDDTLKNIDVEGFYWSPRLGEIINESFSKFQITAGHSKWLPDEYNDPSSVLPDHQDSGLGPVFLSNWVKKAETRVVHAKELGYVVSSGNLFVHPSSGTKLMPYPWNQGVAPDQWKTWTWRNTDVRKRAGKDGGGAPLDQEMKVSGGGFPDNSDKGYYRGGHVRSDALPMMLEFRCYPEPGSIGLNAFDISLASNSSSRPYFRNFSTGGFDTDNNPHYVDPDTEVEGNGGFNPLSLPKAGEETWGRDNSYYIAAADFVTRISRAHSVWLEAVDPVGGEGALFEDPVYSTPITEPRAEDQPDGTKVQLHFRGAYSFDSSLVHCCSDPETSNRAPFENATTLDSFGDYYDHGCVEIGQLPVHNTPQENAGCPPGGGALQPMFQFQDGDERWRADTENLAGAPYYQVRVTFVSEIFTGLSPELSALALSWHD